MEIRIINEKVFDEYSKDHILRSFYQTSAYGEVMKDFGYEPMYIAGYEDENILAASLILTKKMGANMKYGYAPRGFLLNYYDNALFTSFTHALKNFLLKRSFVFVKINPEITTAAIHPRTKERVEYKRNTSLTYSFQELDYYKLRDNIYFESLLPRFNPVIELDKFTLGMIDEKYRKNIENNLNRGIRLIDGTFEDMRTFDKFIQKRKPIIRESYQTYYNVFSSRNMIDLKLLDLNLKDYLEFLTNEYENEKEKNNLTNQKFQNDPKSNAYYAVKLASDMRLNDLLSEISTLNNKVKCGIENEIIGGALAIKYEGRINIVEVGTNPNFDFLEPKHYLYYELISEYKRQGYSYFDMNGITGDFTDRNPYYKVNKFKESFNPNIYEYIGEFDLVINKPLYQYLLSSNKLAKEFDKNFEKTILD